ncbi:prominin-2 [Notechis scutatus]|uniref:Prominin-2 n=1 Tax=Notechis scutatus TaxID=8663 RepID=A0A6J1VQJ0_9SAUR|nr:prominin-2 [Notechis scutatus]
MGHVLLFFLAFAFAHPDLVHSQQCSAEGNHLLTLQFADVGADQRIPAQRQPPGPLDPLYHLVHNYLDVVQQNPFPTGKPWNIRPGLQKAKKKEHRSLTLQVSCCLGTTILPDFSLLPRQGLRLTVEQFRVPQRQILSDLNNISWNIGSTIHFLLKETVSSAMAALKGRVQDLENSVRHLHAIHGSVQALIWEQDELASALKEQKRSLTSLLEEPHCTYCMGVLSRAQDLKLGADFQNVPSVEKVLKNLHGLPQTNFSEMIQKANNSFNAIPQFTVMKMDKVVQELKKDVERVAQKVHLVADDFPISDQTRPMNEALAKAENMSRPFLKEVKPFETYRWIVGTIACTIVLLIVFCNVLGLSFGTYGLVVREDPSDYESRAEAGAKFLIIGVTFSFLFSWILILLVSVTFLVGGNIQTLVCKPWADQEILRFIDTPGNLPPSMNASQYLGLKQNLNLTSAYQQCRNGAGLWEVLQLKDQYSLGEHLSVAKVTSLSLHPGLPPFAKRGSIRLGSFRRILGDKNTPSGSALLQYLASRGSPDVPINMGRKPLDHSLLTSQIKQYVKYTAGWPPLFNQMKIVRELVLQYRLGWGLNFSRRHFIKRGENSHETTGFSFTKSAFNSVFLFLQELDCFARKELGYISQYLNWMRTMLAEDVASCQPFSTALDNGRVILCSRILDPWNAFWFSLGGCAFFLLPGMFLALKMMKHFRPIRHKLVSTGSDETFPFHIPRVTSLRL